LQSGEDGEEMIADVPESGLDTGLLPKVIRGLIQKRRAVKDLIKKETNLAKLTDYDIRQKALKLTANSMYGCLGFTASRFYAKPIAALITSKGREILQKTVDLAQDTLNLDVIYGDTDSIMINTRCTDLATTKKIGNMVKKEVNGLYRELEIEIDGVFKTMLLLKKKKYAALTITEKNGEIKIDREYKGLDIVRRDWCVLSHDVGKYILDQILSRESREDLVDACHDYLRTVAEDVEQPGRVPTAKYVINKGLTKDPKDYADKKNQPHVQVALRMNAAGKSVKALDTVP
jgi:DNA polymerase alpha subunit A